MDQEAILFKALSDSGRREILRLIGEVPLTVGEIARVLHLPQSTVSRHIKLLRECGWLMERRQKNRIFLGLTEPQNGNGERPLADLLNEWLRRQPIHPSLKSQLEQIVEDRDREEGFDRLAHQWDDLRFKYFGDSFHLEALCALLPFEWRVLDIGTGTGFMLPVLSRSFREVVAVDPSPAMLELAKQRSRAESLKNVIFGEGRLENLPLEDASVDAVLAILVTRHASDIDASSKEMMRVLRPGGRVLIADIGPHQDSEFERETRDDSGGIDVDRLVSSFERSGFAEITHRPLPKPRPGAPSAPARPGPNLFLITAISKKITQN